MKRHDGTDMVDDDGKPVFEYTEVITGSHIEEKTIPLSQGEKDKLKDAYRTGFVESYSRHYAKQYASRSYAKAGASYYTLAREIGSAIGTEVAKYRAERDIYNKEYKAQSARSFGDEVEKRYISSFKSLLGVFESNSVYQLNSARLEGEVQDSIFRATEKVRTSFDVTNLGEKENTSSLTLSSSDLSPSQVSSNFSLSPLSSQTLVSPYLASISSNLLAGDTINLGMSITNQSGALVIARELPVTKNQSIELKDYAQVVSVQPSLSINDGELETVATIENAAGITSPSVAEVILESSVSSGTEIISILPLGARESKKVVIKMSRLAPLKLIASNSVTVTVSVKMGGRIISKESKSVSVSGINTTQLYIEYFTALATGVSTNAGDMTIERRLADLSESLDKSVEALVQGKIKWHKVNVASSTVLRAIVDTYLKYQRRGQMTSQGQAEFDELASVLAKKVTYLKAKGLFNDKKAKRAYLAEVGKLSSKISLDPRSY